MLQKVASELREIVWLASVVGGLSVAGVSLAIAVAAALEHWPLGAHV
jgi:orotate phosphoribosyltransferase